MSDHLHLEDMLNDRWLAELSDTITSKPDAPYFLSRSRPAGMIPIRDLTFRTLIHHTDPAKWRVVIFGQCPYPRVESATGIGCCDGKISSWNQALSPTLLNTIKNALIGAGHMTKDEKVGVLRAKLRELDMVGPLDWFQYTLECGVMWLNAALTMKKGDPTTKHAKFWLPVVEKIMDVVITTKASLRADHPDRVMVVVLWGAFAKKLWKMVQRVNAGRIPLRSVEAPNPAAREGFHDIKSFEEINHALASSGSGTINFLPSFTDLAFHYSRERRAQDETVEEAAEVLQAASFGSRRRIFVGSLASGAAARTAPTVGEDSEEENEWEEDVDESASRERARKRLRRMDAPSSRPAAICEEAKENEGACVVCLTNRINSVILNCGHLACCTECVKQLDKCPICRGHIWKSVQIFTAH